MAENPQMIIIEETETGAQYAVWPEVFAVAKDDRFAGFTIISNEDGTPYEEATAETATTKEA